jgi:hypothetical protein
LRGSVSGSLIGSKSASDDHHRQEQVMIWPED